MAHRSGMSRRYRVAEPLVVPKDVPNNVLLYGHYVLGANHLNIMLALDRAIRHLEQKYGFSIEGQTTSEPES